MTQSEINKRVKINNLNVNDLVNQRGFHDDLYEVVIDGTKIYTISRSYQAGDWELRAIKNPDVIVDHDQYRYDLFDRVKIMAGKALDQADFLVSLIVPSNAFAQKQQELKNELGERYNAAKHDMLCRLSDIPFNVIMELLNDQWVEGHRRGYDDHTWDSQDRGHLNP